jgi:ABC-type nitrate/sulfonate/bicarbonate transport system substrate-binding protein
MRRFALFAVIFAAALFQAQTSSAAAPTLTRYGSHFYSRTQPTPCFAHPPKGLPKRLALGCVCPRGEVVPKAPTATYRFALKAGTPFTFAVTWGGHKPKVRTHQKGPYSYVTVIGPRRCAVVGEIFRVHVTPR